MPSNLIGDLAEFDRMRGKEGFDPTRIEGFGPGSPPPPPAPVDARETPPTIQSAREMYGDPVEVTEIEAPEPAPSPLIGLAVRKSAPPLADIPEFWVSGFQAIYRDRPVTLNESERSGMVRIVLKALKRSLDEQYQEVAGTRMRRKTEGKPKRKKAASEHPTS